MKSPGQGPVDPFAGRKVVASDPLRYWARVRKVVSADLVGRQCLVVHGDLLDRALEVDADLQRPLRVRDVWPVTHGRPGTRDALHPVPVQGEEHAVEGHRHVPGGTELCEVEFHRRRTDRAGAVAHDRREIPIDVRVVPGGGRDDGQGPASGRGHVADDVAIGHDAIRGNQRLDGELQHLELVGVGDLDEAGAVEVRPRGVRVAEIQARRCLTECQPCPELRPDCCPRAALARRSRPSPQSCGTDP